MSAFKIFAASLPLFAFTYADDQLPFDAPQAMEEMTPLQEKIEGLASSATEIEAPFVEEYQSLPIEEMQEEVESPNLISTPIVPAVSAEEISSAMSTAIPETVSLPFSTPVLPKKEEVAATVAKPVARAPVSPVALQIDLREVFAGAPFIYCTLIILSIATAALWFYTLLKMRTNKLMPEDVVALLYEKMREGKTEEALAICQSNPSLLSRMVISGLHMNRSSPHDMLERMQNEGKLASGSFWRKLSLLNDVAIVAPMVGLLGTVVGMFYAFYDINRSVDSMNTLFDGLGISVGTTVAGLLLAIVALLLHSTSKYRLVKQLTRVESTANKLASFLPKEERTT